MPTLAKLSFSATGIIAFLISHQAASHGYAEFPPARQVICHNDGGYWSPEGRDIPNAACKAAFDESGTYPFVQINEYAKLVPDYLNQAAVEAAVRDDLLCSAGSTQKAGMSLASQHWQLTKITPDEGGKIEMVWKATAPHNPSFWKFYLTRDGHDFNSALKWEDLEKIYEVGNVPVGPDRKYRINIPMPDGRDGRAILYARWQRIDPAGEGFYNCSDITFTADGTSSEAETTSDFFDHGYYIPVGFPTPLVGDSVSMRGFRGAGGEVFEERVVITEITQSTWPKDLADRVNSRHGTEWGVGLKNTTGGFDFDEANIHANKVWSSLKDDSFVLSIVPKPEPEEESESTPKDSVDTGTWDPNKVYYAGDGVDYGGYSWVSKWWNKDTPPDADDPNNPWESDTAPKAGIAEWDPDKVYHAGDEVTHKGDKWEAKWYTKGEEPGTTGKWGVWRAIN